METRKEGRRVARLRFSVENKSADELPKQLASRLGGIRPSSLPHPREMAPEARDLVGPLYDRLAEFGITQAQALDLTTEFDDERIAANLDYVRAALDGGRQIQNVAAFTMQAIRQDYREGGGEAQVAAQARERRERKDEEARAKSAQARKEKEAAQQRKERQREARRQRERDQAEALDSFFDRLAPAERSRIDALALARMESDAPLVHSKVQQERSAGEPLSKFAASALRSYLHEVLQQEYGDAALGGE
jgi:hypothetical protein